MGGRGLLIASIVLALLAGGVYWSRKKEQADQSKPAADAAPKLITATEDQIRKITISRKDGEITVVERGQDKKWQITAPQPLPADQDAVSSLLGTLSNLSGDRIVEEKAADLSAFGLASPPLEVAISKTDGTAKKVIVGDENPSGSAYFAKVEGDPRVFTIMSGTKGSLEKSSKDLRDKRMLTFDSDKLTRVELTAKGQTMEFGKNTQNEWQIVRPRPLRADSFQVEELVRKLKDAKMDTSLPPEEAKKAAGLFFGGSTVGTAKVTDSSGTQTIEVRKNKEDYYARSSAVEGFYKIAGELGEGLSKTVDDFRNKKLFDFGFDDPSKVEIRDESKTYTLQKSGADWTMGGKKVDASKVQQLIDKLRDLSSIKFVDAGFTMPLVELTVTSKEGKRIEKVLIAKSGDKYFGRRENEPSIYELDPAIVDGIRKAVTEIK